MHALHLCRAVKNGTFVLPLAQSAAAAALLRRLREEAEEAEEEEEEEEEGGGGGASPQSICGITRLTAEMPRCFAFMRSSRTRWRE